jgi:hypothetical protein
MKPGDIAIHKHWKIPVILVSKHAMKNPPIVYWEVLADGGIELIKENEVEKSHESR